MPRSLSTNQTDKLGVRLRATESIAPEDRALLDQLRADHFEATAEVQALLAERLDLETGSRVKRDVAIVEKLKRQPTLPLSRMQDIGGVRVVRDMTRAEQDDLRDRIIATVANPHLIDRRADPRYGYRAVHVVTTVQRCRVEIQLRTRLQHLWAELIETFAGAWGRQVRYGEPPADPDKPIGESRIPRASFLMQLRQFADRIAACQEAVEIVERAERDFGEQASEDDRARLTLAKRELQAERSAIMEVFRPIVQAGVIGRGSG